MYYHVILIHLVKIKRKSWDSLWVLKRKLRELILEIKMMIALPFWSSFTTLVVWWWQINLLKSVVCCMCMSRIFVLLIKPVAFLFSPFLCHHRSCSSSLVALPRETILDIMEQLFGKLEDLYNGKCTIKRMSTGTSAVNSPG